MFVQLESMGLVLMTSRHIDQLIFLNLDTDHKMAANVRIVH